MSTRRPLPSCARCDRCGGQMVMAYGDEPYCPDMACHIGTLRPAAPALVDPPLSVVLGRVVALVVATALAGALGAALIYGAHWNPVLSTVIAAIMLAALNDELGKKVPR